MVQYILGNTARTLGMQQFNLSGAKGLPLFFFCNPLSSSRSNRQARPLESTIYEMRF